MTANKPATLNRDIAPGEVFEHTGPLVLNGHVGAGARVAVKKGGLEINGDVADRADIHVEVENQSVSVGNIVGRSSVSIINGVVIVDGKVVSGAGNQGDGPKNLKIAGVTGAHVTLFCSNAIEICDAGPGLNARAGNAFEAGNLGENARIGAGNALAFDTAAGGSALEAGNGLTGQRLGHGSSARAGNTIKINEIADSCQIHAGNGVQAGSIGAAACVHAGNSVRAETADRSARLTAGNKVRVENYTGPKP